MTMNVAVGLPVWSDISAQLLGLGMTMLAWIRAVRSLDYRVKPDNDGERRCQLAWFSCGYR